jgi:threonine dehydratase
MYVRDNIPSIDDLFRAQKLMDKDVVRKTPLLKSNTFSTSARTNIFLKLELFQKTGSFKVRGAYTKINSLTNDQCKSGVIATSAGNHAYGSCLCCTQEKNQMHYCNAKMHPLQKLPQRAFMEQM